MVTADEEPSELSDSQLWWEAYHACFCSTTPLGSKQQCQQQAMQQRHKHIPEPCGSSHAAYQQVVGLLREAHKGEESQQEPPQKKQKNKKKCLHYFGLVCMCSYMWLLVCYLCVQYC
jgi:hypothetical protein